MIDEPNGVRRQRSRGNSPSKSNKTNTEKNAIRNPSRKFSPSSNKKTNGFHKLHSSGSGESVLSKSRESLSNKSGQSIDILSRDNSPPRTNPSSGQSGHFTSYRRKDSEIGSVEDLDEHSIPPRIITSPYPKEDNINVVVRVRPLSKKEAQYGNTDIVQFLGNGQIMINEGPGAPNNEQKPKLFSFNVVFEPAASQEDILQFSGIKRLIDMAVEGFHCTCFCYGQTGSGKTHTLTGPPTLIGFRTLPYSNEHGLIFRSFQYLFQQIQEQSNTHFVLKASYLEIYNEKVIDLLNPGSARKSLAVRWSKKARGFFVENLFTVDCEELDDLVAVLEEGMRNRHTGKHNMNDFSSRSHTILTVYIKSEQPAENGVFISKSGKINFVDLAGSEMTKKTQSEGKTLEEANNINKSLMVLGYCISSLSETKKRSHIPYRDSKLTKLLADSLTGNGVTLMIACVSPAKSNRIETLNTLRYAARTKKIRTKPVVLMDPREALILSLKREVEMLHSENQYLRGALQMNTTAYNLNSGKSEGPPKVHLADLGQLDGRELSELVHLYVEENGELRKENLEIFTSRELLQRDHELVCRENERLLKKLEEVNLSPVIGVRSAFSAEAINISADNIQRDIWTSPSKEQNNAAANNEMPKSLLKELERRLGSRTSQTRPKSLEEKNIKPVRIKSTGSDTSAENAKKPTKPKKYAADLESGLKGRFSMANVFGKPISPTDEDNI